MFEIKLLFVFFAYAFKWNELKNILGIEVGKGAYPKCIYSSLFLSALEE